MYGLSAWVSCCFCRFSPVCLISVFRNHCFAKLSYGDGERNPTVLGEHRFHVDDELWNDFIDRPFQSSALSQGMHGHRDGYGR